MKLTYAFKTLILVHETCVNPYQMEIAQRTNPFDIFRAINIRHQTLTGHVERANFNSRWMPWYVQEAYVQCIDRVSLSGCHNRIVGIT
jgi:hypothetical protein